ncbi:glycosyltransferase family 25 protein [Azospirillum argentinense]
MTVSDPVAAQAMPVYCINLARSAARRAHMDGEFARIGWAARYVRAVDGPLLVDAAAMLASGALAADNEGLTGPLTAGEIGCYLSHERAWRSIRDGGARAALVCEDDVRFRAPFLDREALAAALPEDCDILYLHYLDGGLGPDAAIAPPFERETSRPAATAGAYGIHRAWSCGGSQCYCLTARGAAKLLAAARPIRFPVDGQLGRLGYTRELTVYALHPMAAESGWMPSTIRPS